VIDARRPDLNKPRQYLTTFSASLTPFSFPPSLPDGTHVAGTIGGTNFGIAKNANLYCVKVLDNNASGSTAEIISGLDAAVVQARATCRPSVISMSLGGPPSSSIDSAVCFFPVNY